MADATEMSAARGMMTVEMSFMARRDRENARSNRALWERGLMGKFELLSFYHLTRPLGHGDH